MTAITASRGLSRATRFERALLRASSGIDRFVQVRVERRAAQRPSTAQARALEARLDAQAMAVTGMLPR